MHRDKIFNNADKRIKIKYLGIIGVIMQTHSFETIKHIIQDALIVANYPEQGQLEDGTILPTEQSMIRIEKLLRTHDIQSFEKETGVGIKVEDEYPVDVYDNTDNTTDDDNNIEWYTKILDDVLNKLNGLNLSSKSESTTTNWWEFQAFNGFCGKLMKRLPLWSSIMQKPFESIYALGTSADIESRFNIIKNNVFKKYKLPIRIETFTKLMLEESNAVAKLCRIMSPTNDLKQTEIIIDNYEDGELILVSLKFIIDFCA